MADLRSNMRLTSSVVEMNDAFEAIESFYERGWSDGLPIVPPTEDAVDKFLQAAGLAPGHVLGTEPVKGGVATAEKVAINSIMAGCRPEYMPVVAAAVEAITADEFNLHAITASTMGASILALVSGPAAVDAWRQFRHIRLRTGAPGKRDDRTRAPAHRDQSVRLAVGRDRQGDSWPSGQVHVVLRRVGGSVSMDADSCRKGRASRPQRGNGVTSPQRYAGWRARGEHA